MENYQNNEVFGWDDTISEESSFILLPEGDYRFSIEKFERARHNGSEKIPPCPKAVVTFRIYNSNGSSALVTENYFLARSMEWKLSEFFASVGMKKKGEETQMRWSPELVGKQGVCKVIVRTYQKDGENKQINRIDKLYPSYAQPALSENQQFQPIQHTGWSAGKF